MDTANRFLRETYLSRYTARFAVEGAEAGSGFVLVAEDQQRKIFAFRRIVSSPRTTPSIGTAGV